MNSSFVSSPASPFTCTHARRQPLSSGSIHRANVAAAKLELSQSLRVHRAEGSLLGLTHTWLSSSSPSTLPQPPHSPSTARRMDPGRPVPPGTSPRAATHRCGGDVRCGRPTRPQSCCPCCHRHFKAQEKAELQQFFSFSSIYPPQPPPAFSPDSHSYTTAGFTGQKLTATAPGGALQIYMYF